MDNKITLTKVPNGYHLRLKHETIFLTTEEFNALYGALFIEHYEQERKKYDNEA